MNSWLTTKLRNYLLIILFFFTNSMWAQETNLNPENKIRTVVIDPGHGGKDSGAVGKKGKEKDIALAIGLKLGQYLEENVPDVKVIYTRKTDEFIPLYKRAEIANQNNADLFISIHVNGVSSTKAYGTETLVLGLHRSEENFEVAKRENSVILLEEDHSSRYENFDPNSPESYIIFKYVQNVYDKHSLNFAGYVQDQFRDRARRKDRGVKRQGLLVLAQTSMPGVLVETGFVSNPTEEKYLLSDDGQSYIASAIYRAFKEYKKDFEAVSLDGSEQLTAEKAEGNPTTTEAESEVKTEMKDPAGTSDENIPDSKPVKNEDKPVVDTNASEGLYFKVQVLSSSTSVPMDSTDFGEFNDIEEFKNGASFKYAVGHKKSYEEILAFSKLVKNRFPDAFIIAVQNGEIIPLQDARKLQN
ncbi:MAG: N-acetylmuramoyl-L-alanine amidase [Bacteroidales bacterium]|nr:N-acetylmuramoyl-L-alanine amidase [Bacteroidales bacterium]